MLTTTDPRDLAQELKALRDMINNLTAEAEYIAGAVETRLFGPQGDAELLRGLVSDPLPDGPLGPVDAFWEKLWNLKREVLDGTSADLEAKGGEIYDRLDRACELLQTAA